MRVCMFKTDAANNQNLKNDWTSPRYIYPFIFETKKRRRIVIF